MLRDRIEEGFGRWGVFVFRHARSVLALGVLLSAVLGWWLPQLEMDTSEENLLRPSSAVRVSLARYRDLFGDPDRTVILVSAPNVFDLDYLERLRAFHEDFEREVPQLKSIASLLNARHTRGTDGLLIVEDMVQPWPQGSADLAQLRARVMSNPLHRGFLVAEDGTWSSLFLELDTYSSIDDGGEMAALAGFDDEDPTDHPRQVLTVPEVVANLGAIHRVVARHSAPEFQIRVAGEVVLAARLFPMFERNIAVFVAVSVAAIAACLFLLFGRTTGVLLPLLVVGLSVSSTLSLMAYAGVPITVATLMLPSFLLAVGICDSVHILTLFYRALDAGADRCTAIAKSLSHSGLAVVMTSLTTAGGVASFAAADVQALREFGIFAPAGILLAMVFSLALLPALLALVPLRSTGGDPVHSPLTRVQPLLVRLGEIAIDHSGAVLFGTAIVIALAILGIFRIQFAHDPLSWLPKDEPLRADTEWVDRALGGGLPLVALVETGEANRVHEPAILDKFEALRRWAPTVDFEGISVGRTISVADILKEIHRALNEDRPEFYSIPRDRQVVAQEFLLFENAGSDDLEGLVDRPFQSASFLILVEWADGMVLEPFSRRFESKVRETFGSDARVSITGSAVMLAEGFTGMIRSMSSSYLLAFLIVTPLMVLLVGNLRLGLISMIPNMTPIVLTLGLMGWLGVAIDVTTLMIGAIILGVAVDDTIHFLHNFSRFRRAGEDARESARHTLATTGLALFVTSLVLAAGFFTYGLATLSNLVSFGLFAGLAIILAFLADVIIAPALVTLRVVSGPRASTTPIVR